MLDRAGLPCSSAFGSISSALARTPSSIRSPSALSTLRQYSNARSQHRLGHPVEQVPDDVVDQPVAGRVVEDVAHHRARLAPVVVLGVVDVGGAHDVAVGVPARHAGRSARCRRPGPPFEFGAYTGSVTVVDAHRAVLAVRVHRALSARSPGAAGSWRRCGSGARRRRRTAAPAASGRGWGRCRAPGCWAGTRPARSRCGCRWGCGPASSGRPRSAGSRRAATPWSGRTG